MAAVDELEHQYEASPRGWLKRILWIALLVIVITGSTFLVRWRISVSRAEVDLDALITDLDQADPHWRIEDIEANRTEIPDAENTALVIGQIETGLRAKRAPVAGPQGTPTPLDGAFESPPDVQIEPDIQAHLRAELKQVAPELKLALTLAAMRHGRFPLSIAPDGFSTIIHSQAAREVINLLQKEVFRRLRDGDIEGACIAARAMLVAARSVGDEPFIVSQLIRIACVLATTRNLERILAQGEPTESALATMQKMLEEEESTPYLRTAFRGERGLEQALMNAFEDGKVSLSALSVGNAPTNSNPLEKLLSPVQSRSAAKLARPELLRKMTEYIEISQLPETDRLDQFNIKEQELKDGSLPVLVRALLPGVVKLADADARVRASIRLAITALASERFRLASNRWPKDLAELTPAYLKAVPLDPYDGKPLKMRATDDGLVVYSIGKDRKDNGGKVDRKMARPGDNIVFQLWNVDERRKPAMNPDVGPPRPTEEDLQNMMMREWMPQNEAPKGP
jgi:hypothetical protein